MGHAAHRNILIKRSPRYQVRENDGIRMRFFSAKTKRIVPVDVVDISDSGVAFVTNVKHAPKIGEVLKVDFNPPGSMQIACLARVVRMEEPVRDSKHSGYDKIKIAVTFHNLPMSYQRLLTESISEVIGMEMKSQSQQAFWDSVYNSWWYQNLYSIFFSTVLLGLFAWGIWVLSNRESTEPFRATNSGWAKGFFDRTIKKDQDE